MDDTVFSRKVMHQWPTILHHYRDLNFVISELAGLDEINQLPGFEHATNDLLEPILEEASRFAREVLGPTNVIGDQQGCSVDNGVVKVPSEFSTPTNCSLKAAGRGWIALTNSAVWGCRH